MSLLEELDRRGIKITKSDQTYDGVNFLKTSTGKIIPCDDRKVYITSGTEYEGQKVDAAKLASEGKIFSFKGYDLYAEFYDFAGDPELECWFKYRYSPRSRKYIEATMEKIGLIEYADKTEPSDFDVEYDCDIFMDARTFVGKSGDRWIAQTIYWYIVDDYVSIEMYFDHCPTVREVETAFEVYNFDKKPIETYTCRGCGKRIFWLDTPPKTIAEKRSLVSEQYCGCC